MRPKTLSTLGLVLSLVLAIVLSGCTGGKTAASVALEPAAEPEFDADTGAIQGTVVDDEFVAIVGASVGILDLDLVSLTDADGRFTFSHLAPGIYDVQASKIGFDNGRGNVEVVANDVGEVTIELRTAVDLGRPYPLYQSQGGFFGCGMSWSPAVVFSGLSACALVKDVTETDVGEPDKFMLEWPTEGPIRSMKAAVFEMEWDSTQALGAGLTLIVEIDGCVNADDREGRFGVAEGGSPLKLYVDEEKLAKLFDPSDTKCEFEDLFGDPVDKNCGEAQCTIVTRVFSTTSDVAGPESEADLGVTYQQAFTQHMTLFFNAPPEQGEAYTAIPE